MLPLSYRIKNKQHQQQLLLVLMKQCASGYYIKQEITLMFNKLPAILISTTLGTRSTLVPCKDQMLGVNRHIYLRELLVRHMFNGLELLGDSIWEIFANASRIHTRKGSFKNFKCLPISYKLRQKVTARELCSTNELGGISEVYCRCATFRITSREQH